MSRQPRCAPGCVIALRLVQRTPQTDGSGLASPAWGLGAGSAGRCSDSAAGGVDGGTSGSVCGHPASALYYAALVANRRDNVRSRGGSATWW